MAIQIVPNSAKITILQTPTVVARLSLSLPNLALLGATPQLRVQGELSLGGNAGDLTKDWRVGWIQAQWIETSWSYYRGQTNNDGSIFLQLSRPPARFQNACRDAFGSIGDIFYSLDPIQFDPDTNTSYPPSLADSPVGNPPGSFPIMVQVSMADTPYTLWDLSVPNNLTKKDNYLAEAQLENHFCTVLTVQDSNGKFYHQAHFYWNVRAQARFTPKRFPPSPADWAVTPQMGFTRATIGKIIQGAPTDKRFAGVLTSQQTKSCNDLSDDVYKSIALPNSPNRHESRVWQNFDVRKP